MNISVQYFTVCCNCSGAVSTLQAEYTSAGTLTTDNYPSAYPSNSNCNWLLEAADSSHKVVVYFEEFLTEESYDYLYIYDGNSDTSTTLLFSGSGDFTGNWWVSSTQYLYLRFTSDYSVEYTGISIKYISADSDAQDIGCPPPATANSLPAQISSIYLEYPCNYQISNTGGRVRFSVLIDGYSSLRVYDGSSSSDNLIVEYYSWFTDTNIYQSTGSNIFIVKPSSGKFVLYYEAVDASAPAPTIAVTEPTTIHYEYSCSGYQLTATTSFGHILSPEHPNNYPNNLDCDATIIAQNSSSSIEFIFLDIQLLYCCDYVEIFDGPDSTYNSWGITWSVGDTRISTGSTVHIKFHTDSSGTLQGFQIDYREVTREIPSCLPAFYNPYDANANEQIIASPNYPGDYNNDMLEYWLIIKPSETDNIVLNIRDIHIEHSFDCGFDRLTIYDGACTDAPKIADICGSEETVLQDSSGLYILVEFSTDYSVTYKGFEMEFYIGEYHEEEYHEEETFDPTLLYIVGIVVGGIIIFIVVCACCQYHKWRKSSYVSPGTPPAPVVKTKPIEPKRLTTHQLLIELQSRYGTEGQNKQPKPQRKMMNKYQPQPGPSGISTIGGYSSPHPPPQPPFGYPPPPYAGHTQDPAYPPNFFEAAAKQAQGAPKPAIVPASELGPPSAPPVTMFIPDTTPIPGPSTYMTPADARKAGVYA